MDYLNISKNVKCSKLFADSNVLFSSNILDRKNKQRILVLAENMTISILSASSFNLKREIPITHVSHVTISPGRDQVMVLHIDKRFKDAKDVLCAFLDEAGANFTAEEESPRLGVFLDLLAVQFLNFDKQFNTDDYYRTASKIHVDFKGKRFTLKFVCTAFPHHTDYLKFITNGKKIQYNVPVLFGKHIRNQSTNGLHVLDHTDTTEILDMTAESDLQL